VKPRIGAEMNRRMPRLEKERRRPIERERGEGNQDADVPFHRHTARRPRRLCRGPAERLAEPRQDLPELHHCRITNMPFVANKSTAPAASNDRFAGNPDATNGMLMMSICASVTLELKSRHS